jgi:hypothetical protein
MTGSEPLERRRHRRHDVEVPARYWVDDPDSAIDCEVLDISEGGLCIGLPDWSALDLAPEATVELPIPGAHRAVPAAVEVKGVGGRGRPVVRMRFLDTTMGFRRTIGHAARAWVHGAGR